MLCIFPVFVIVIKEEPGTYGDPGMRLGMGVGFASPRPKCFM